ncbi:MAG TPA: hypothetical protein VN282_11325 [Pyrinomonadaceae bacterium]|nr:hypothetical protein [Pyrinomonadaceae bacterium]
MQQPGGIELWNPNTRVAKLQNPVEPLWLLVSVADKLGKQRFEKIEVVLFQRPKQLPGAVAKLAQAEWKDEQVDPPGAGGYDVEFIPSAQGVTETLRVVAPNRQAEVTLRNKNGDVLRKFPLAGKLFTVDVGADDEVGVEIRFEAEPASVEFFDLWYKYERPSQGQVAAVTPLYVSNFPPGTPDKDVDERFLESTMPATAGGGADPYEPNGADALREWLDKRVPVVGNEKRVTLHGYSSYESDPNKFQYNWELSKRRLQVTWAVLNSYVPPQGVTLVIKEAPEVIPLLLEDKNATPQEKDDELDNLGAPRGHSYARLNKALHGDVPTHADFPTPYPPAKQQSPGAPLRHGDKDDRVVTISAALGGHAEVVVTGRVTRGPSTELKPPDPPKPPAPPPPLNEPPPVFQRLGLRVRVERNLVVLAEVSGTLDFETQTEKGLRNALQNSPGGNAALPPADQKMIAPSADGVIEFAITVTYDTASKYITETLRLGSGEGDTNGLWKPVIVYETPKNILGAMLTFMPIMGESIPETLSPNPADWALMAVTWAFPIAADSLDYFQTTRLVLYGGELRFRQHVPAAGNVLFTDAAVIFDYGVEFEIHIDPLNIHSTRPLRVRYRAVGFNLHFDTGPNDEIQYQPIFDPSKGYELDLSDPALFGVTGLLGDLFRVLGVRIARFNPFTLELDLGLKVDLGLVTVDTFKVKWPLDPPDTPMILPSGVHVNLEKTIVGSGYVNVTDSGFMGTIDITIVPLKIRVAASLAVQKIEDVATGRMETGVYFGLTVEFPTPIVLGASGLGIYGFSALFAMHYRRMEGEPTPQDSVGPALAWLKKAEGEPARLTNDQSEVLWEPKLDHWSFGLGVVLGTLEGGFLANLRGMLLLELPGPRVLVFVKMQVITNLPGLGDEDVDVGLLGVLDIDFNLKRITIGVIINFKYQKEEPGEEGGDLLQVRIPIELFFDFKSTAVWHLYIGTIEGPASMNILGIVKGTGYFMLDAEDIPSPAGTLGGVAIAAGIYAPMIWGSESIGLYAKIYAKADVGFSLSPFAFVGNLTIGGELRLFIIGIEVHASLMVSAPPVYFKGELCGSVDFFFFEIEGCVDVSFGSQGAITPAAPALVTNCWIQSFAPVIASGQGGDRPIDASLGDAATTSGGDLPVVPIDAVPVLQLIAPPQVTPATASYTESLKLAPGYVDVNGWSEVGGDVRSRYTLKSIKLFELVPDSGEAEADFGADLPPAVWRREPVEAANGQKTNLDLALGSRTPVTAAFALERSTELKTIVTEQWEGICEPAAPPACVLWTFCDVPLGGSGKGWTLTGAPYPDPPGTTRDVPPPTQLYVEEPTLNELEVAASQLAELYGDPYLIPARVLGTPPAGGSPKQIELVKCLRALHLPKLWRGAYQGPPVNKPPAYVDAQNKIKKSQWITLKTGAASAVKLFLALEPRFVEVGVCRLRQLRKDGQVISDEPLLSLPHKEIKQPADFPKTWTDAASPWKASVQEVSTFLGGGKFAALKKLLFNVTPREGCVALQIYVVPELFNLELSLLVGAVEVCSLAEKARYEYETTVKKQESETILDFLEPSGKPAPLLKPDRQYRIEVAYDSYVQVKGKDDKGHFNQQTVEAESNPKPLPQNFYFRTDKRAPNRLDPWVLGTTPHTGEQYHFYKEPIKVVFNDQSAVPLFAAHNVKLTFSIRGADGAPVLPEPPKAPFFNPPDQVVAFDLDGYLDVKESDFNSPYYEVLSEVVEVLPCVNGSGQKTKTDTSVVKALLAPLMNYTFDIEPAKLDPDKEMELMPFLDKDGNALPVKGRVPFFRRPFKTSRYESMGQFAGEVLTAKILHRRLSGQLALLPEGTAADDQIQQALLDAGEQTLPAPTENRVVIYWTAAGEGQPSRQRAILIDTVEPHWRWRDEADLTPVQKSPDPNFMRVTVESKPSLVVGEKAGGASVERWVYSAGGARTLVYLDPDKLPTDAPAEVTLVLRQKASEVFELEEKAADFVKVVLTPQAPWEE